MASSSGDIPLPDRNDTSSRPTENRSPDGIRVAEADQLEGGSLGGNRVESHARTGGTPLPPVDFHQLRGFTPRQVVDWLDGLAFFQEFNDEEEVAQDRDEFLTKDLSGSTLLRSGYDAKNLQPALCLGKALRVSAIIKGVYGAEGIFPILFTNKTMLTINQGLHCRMEG